MTRWNKQLQEFKSSRQSDETCQYGGSALWIRERERRAGTAERHQPLKADWQAGSRPDLYGTESDKRYCSDQQPCCRLCYFS